MSRQFTPNRLKKIRESGGIGTMQDAIEQQKIIRGHDCLVCLQQGDEIAGKKLINEIALKLKCSTNQEAILEKIRTIGNETAKKLVEARDNLYGRTFVVGNHHLAVDHPENELKDLRILMETYYQQIYQYDEGFALKIAEIMEEKKLFVIEEPNAHGVGGSIKNTSRTLTPMKEWSEIKDDDELIIHICSDFSFLRLDSGMPDLKYFSNNSIAYLEYRLGLKRNTIKNKLIKKSKEIISEVAQIREIAGVSIEEGLFKEKRIDRGYEGSYYLNDGGVYHQLDPKKVYSWTHGFAVDSTVALPHWRNKSYIGQLSLLFEKESIVSCIEYLQREGFAVRIARIKNTRYRNEISTETYDPTMVDFFIRKN